MAYNKSDLVSKIAQKSNLTKAQAEAAVNAFQDVFVEAMQSGEGLIPATYGVRISAGSLLKKAVTK